MRTRLVLCAAAATAASLLTTAVVRSQAPTTPEPAPTAPAPAAPNAPSKPAPKPHKIWTDDDVAIYVAQREAHAQADASGKLHSEANAASTSSPQTKLPNSLEDVERAIRDSLEDIRDQKDTLARLSKELGESPEDQTVQRTKELERRTAILQESEKELKSLQAKRDDLVVKAMIPVPVISSSCKSVTSSCHN